MRQSREAGRFTAGLESQSSPFLAYIAVLLVLIGHAVSYSHDMTFRSGFATAGETESEI
jgi:hypothetical protein